MELTKIQDDLFKGDVLYHNSIVKTEEEIIELKKKLAEKKRQKELRKKAQAVNVERKQNEKDHHKARSLAGSTRKYENRAQEGYEEAVDDDAEYYREELGEEPDEGKTNSTHNFATQLFLIRNQFLLHFGRFVQQRFDTQRWPQACLCTQVYGQRRSWRRCQTPQIRRQG